MNQRYYVKTGDTGDTISYDLTNLPGPVASVAFKMRKSSATALKVDDAATYVANDSSSGRATYQWQTADLDTAGLYLAEFEATLASGGKLTYPNGEDEYIEVVITDDLDP